MYFAYLLSTIPIIFPDMHVSYPASLAHMSPNQRMDTYLKFKKNSQTTFSSVKAE